MTILRLTRFTLKPSVETDTMLSTRAELIEAVRAKFPGLTETRLAKVDDTTWLDLWRWESNESLQAALAGAPALPQAAAAFALVEDATEERMELVEER
ncbi:hypothetical protein GCM10009789_75740 [Kribbella sancticallisti]|uniref:ABM domain-containing protein n=1 Tax=Kribbella sancticallisti TaxID=460087 RepID=A0ABP4QJW1_9ACTN